MSPRTLVRKARTGLALLRDGGLRPVVRVLAGKLLRVNEFRVDRLDLEPLPLALAAATGAAERFACAPATPEQMEALFAEWRDSAAERERHRRVYETFGFRRCFLLSEPGTDRVLHFQFLLTEEDRPAIERFLPRAIFRPRLRPDAAWQEWLYTFEDARGRNLTLLATVHVARYCLDRGITTLYSRRGVRNQASVRTADRIGYTVIARAYELRFRGQAGSSGQCWIRPFRRRP
jgi:hypothetical protein